jgi:hypothetical protein
VAALQNGKVAFAHRLHLLANLVAYDADHDGKSQQPRHVQHVEHLRRAAGRLPSLRPIGYSRPYLACRIWHFIPIWQPCIGSLCWGTCVPPRWAPINAKPHLGKSSEAEVAMVYGHTSLNPIGCSRSYLACRIGHYISNLQQYIGSL